MTASPVAATSIEERLALLEATEQLRRLAHDYCHGLDKRDLHRFLAIWTADAVWALGGDTNPRGHEEIGRTAAQAIWPSFTDSSSIGSIKSWRRLRRSLPLTTPGRAIQTTYC